MGKRYTKEERRAERGRAGGGERGTPGATEPGPARCADSPGGAWFFRQAPEAVDPGRKHSFIRAHLGRWPVAAMCRALGVSEQGYYRALRRPEQGWRDRELLKQIYECLQEDEENGRNYGVRRIIAWLRLHRGYTGSDRRIYRICREHCLTIRPRRRPNGITRADREAEKSENLINETVPNFV